jgi:hypothetical protein
VLGAEGVQDIAATRVPDQNWPLHTDCVNDLEEVVGPALRIVSRRRVIRGADTTPGEGVHPKPIGQLRRDLIVDMPGEVAPHKYNRSSGSAPIQHLQSNGRRDGDEPHSVRRRIAPDRPGLPGEQEESYGERYCRTHAANLSN